MTNTLAARLAPMALAALMTSAMLVSTSALANHQYRVSAASQQRATEVAVVVQHVTIVGHRSARA